MAKSEIQIFSSIQMWMLLQSQSEIGLVCSCTWLVLLNRIEERYFASLCIGNLLNEKWIPKLLLSKPWHWLLILDIFIIEHSSMKKSWFWDKDEHSQVCSVKKKSPVKKKIPPWKLDLFIFLAYSRLDGEIGDSQWLSCSLCNTEKR